MTILVTGSAGMIGSSLVKALIDKGYDVIGIDKKPISFNEKYEHFLIDLGDIQSLNYLFNARQIDRIVHLAALAHTTGNKKYPKSLYKHLNVECAKNIFEIAEKRGIPILFISTVDVFGFQKGVVDETTVCKPVTIYGKTKFEAEQLLVQSKCHFTIFRLSPVYTQNIKRDIQKRYYLKYPNWAYQIGKNSFYEVLDVNKATEVIVSWLNEKPHNEIKIIKDEKLLETRTCIQSEKKAERAKHVIYIPRWIALICYFCLRITGKNKYTFLLNKALYPLRSI